MKSSKYQKRRVPSAEVARDSKLRLGAPGPKFVQFRDTETTIRNDLGHSLPSPPTPQSPRLSQSVGLSRFVQTAVSGR